MSNNWSREELLAAFNLYCRLPFGKLHRGNPEIITLAQKMGRSPSAVAMKLVNFASFDPVHQARQVKGLSNAGRADREIWDEFSANPEQIAFDSQQALLEITKADAETILEPEVYENEFKELSLPSGPTETTRLVRTRLVQGFFRDAVLASYNYSCAVCALDLAELLTASHIIPWSKNVERLADPRNGLALCALHDRAFDRGLFTLDDSLHVLLSAKAQTQTENPMRLVALYEMAGRPITLPKRFLPDVEALAYHRENIFQ